MSSKIKVDTIENVAGSGNVSLGSGHNLVVPGNQTVGGTLGVTGATTTAGITSSAAHTVTTSTHANASVFKSTGHTQIMLQDTDASSNDQFWGLQNSGGDFNILTCNDDRASGFVTPMTITQAGQVTKPLQAFFNAKRDSAVQLTSGTYQDIAFGTEYKDIGSNFDGTTFTAPVTGVYSFSIGVRLDNADTAASYYNFWLATSNRGYHQLRDLAFSGDSIFIFAMNVIADMDANDTAKLQINQQGGTNQTNVNNSTFFMGYLLG